MTSESCFILLYLGDRTFRRRINRHGQFVAKKILQSFLVQNICASSIKFVESNIEKWRIIIRNCSSFSNKFQKWIEIGFTHLQNPWRFSVIILQEFFVLKLLRFSQPNKSFRSYMLRMFRIFLENLSVTQLI